MVFYKAINLLAMSFTFQSLAIASSDTRSIFLNGIDISSAKHQTLENVTVRIDGQGHLYIEAPHYEVNEESTYIPLSSWNREGFGLPKHAKRGEIPNSNSKMGTTSRLPQLSNQVKPVTGQEDPSNGEKADQDGNGNPTQVPAGTGANIPTTPANGQPAARNTGGQ